MSTPETVPPLGLYGEVRLDRYGQPTLGEGFGGFLVNMSLIHRETLTTNFEDIAAIGDTIPVSDAVPRHLRPYWAYAVWRFGDNLTNPDLHRSHDAFMYAEAETLSVIPQTRFYEYLLERKRAYRAQQKIDHTPIGLRQEYCARAIMRAREYLCRVEVV